LRPVDEDVCLGDECLGLLVVDRLAAEGGVVECGADLCRE
jgi:hypothetical protein